MNTKHTISEFPYAREFPYAQHSSQRTFFAHSQGRNENTRANLNSDSPDASLKLIAHLVVGMVYGCIGALIAGLSGNSWLFVSIAFSLSGIVGFLSCVALQYFLSKRFTSAGNF